MCVAELAFSQLPVLWAGRASREGCPRQPTALDTAQTVAEHWAPGGTPQGPPWAFPRRTPDPGAQGSRARLRLCSHKRTRCQGASATGGPAPGPSETPNADAGCSGPPWAGLALRFLLSWAGVDEGATCRGCSGRLEGEGGGSQPPAALSPGVFLALDSRHRGCGREAQRQAILSLP